jgi:hypothetical protein
VSDKEVIMLKGLLKLASGIVVLGASVLAAVARQVWRETGWWRHSAAKEMKRHRRNGEPQGELISAVTPNQGPRVARRAAPSVLRGEEIMSEEREGTKVDTAFDGVPIYRVTLVREPTVLEASRTTIRTSSEAAEIVHPLFVERSREFPIPS